MARFTNYYSTKTLGLLTIPNWHSFQDKEAHIFLKHAREPSIISLKKREKLWDMDENPSTTKTQRTPKSTPKLTQTTETKKVTKKNTQGQD